MKTDLKLTSLILVSILFTCTTSPYAASFDCAEASTKVENMICSNQQLSELDENVAMAYRQALMSKSNKESLKSQQREWLTAVRNKCDDSNCLEVAYVARLKQIAPAGKKDGRNFSGQWHLSICNKHADKKCGGFTVYLIQTEKAICGDHFFATPGWGRLNEGSPRSIIGSITESNVANIEITSGRNGSVYKVLATKNNDILNWEITEEIKRGHEGDSALVLDKGRLRRVPVDSNYQAASSACQGL